MKDRTNWETPQNVERLREIEVLTRQRPMTVERLAELMELTVPLVYRVLRHLDKRVHIGDWTFAGKRRGAPMYSWGEAPDAPYPMGAERDQEAESMVRYDSRVIRRDRTVAMFFGEARA